MERFVSSSSSNSILISSGPFALLIEYILLFR
uniref:Uncharacterized protein n=1 Tax=Lepeophtheirus salmonis TaxID=72036 RepID=A0A0K2TAH2_LEPSM